VRTLERPLTEWAPDDRGSEQTNTCPRCGRPVLSVHIDGSVVIVDDQAEYRVVVEGSVHYLDDREKHIGRVTRVHAAHRCDGHRRGGNR